MAQDNQGPLVLFYTAFFGRPPPFDTAGCSVPVRLTFDRSRLAEADIVIFHIPDAWEIGDALKYAGQVWVAFSMEASAHYPLWTDPAFMRRFDLIMSHETAADIWTPYLPPMRAWQAAVDRPLPAKTEFAPAVMFQSASVDRSRRNDFALELMKAIRVDSYGRLLRNRDLAGPDLGRQTKLDTIARYHFCCAFENAISHGYVTEKIFDPLLSGTIPIYRGAPDVADFVPAGSYIDVSDFPSPIALADHLRRILKDEEAYARYFEWRMRPLPPFLADRLALVQEPALGRLAAIASSRIAPGSERARGWPSLPFGLRRFLETRLRRLVRTHRQRRSARRAIVSSGGTK
ncbi:alpha-1,3-fucosyltransferase [Phreatobacter aquaticus]|uniref:Alpha-1,3-fucosyltransferase n=1 Tax=Phreatobacter aquaticus TaxID=2570229 RepID=A0A4D7QH38_9HYPH|nr:glycosyltransferase family 10 [Phreatobacter aquaticus]QCK86205.1 alpha-1,3-fucosyltransferase [Phreatobacter aquaticus]